MFADRGKAFLLSTLLTMLLSCSRSEQEAYGFLQGGDPEPGDWERLPFTSIRYDFHSNGQVEAPSFQVILRADGTATYEGRHHVARIGRFEAGVGLVEYGRLNYLFEELELFRLEGSFLSDTNHQDDVVLTLTRRDGRDLLIRDYGDHAPAEFWAYCAALEKTVSRLRWSAVAGGS